MFYMKINPVLVLIAGTEEGKRGDEGVETDRRRKQDDASFLQEHVGWSSSCSSPCYVYHLLQCQWMGLCEFLVLISFTY